MNCFVNTFYQLLVALFAIISKNDDFESLNSISVPLLIRAYRKENEKQKNSRTGTSIRNLRVGESFCFLYHHRKYSIFFSMFKNNE